MIETGLTQLLSATGGELLSGGRDTRFRGVSIDSRTIRPGELFICIHGDRFDGHDFLDEVAGKQAAGVVVSRPGAVPASWSSPASSPPFVVRVADTLKALQDLARNHRDRFPVRVVGVTGTNGKSTTKEMIAAISSIECSTLKNRGNLNNHIGLPLTLFGLEPGHEVAVLEMGMSARGEIARLAEIARPEIGVITNISEAHLEQLKSVREVQSAKGELFEALPDDGTAIVNADDPLVLELARALRVRQVTFGIENPADVRAGDIHPKDHGGFDCTLRLFGRILPLHIPFPGRFNIYNALAALAAGQALGLDAESMTAGLAQCRALGQRLEITRHQSLTIINDTYNANPQSMREALKTLRDYDVPGRKFLVMGGMLELGEISHAAHAGVGREIAAGSVDFLVTVGDLAAVAAEAARTAGMPGGRVVPVATHAEAVEFLADTVAPGDCLLFKGSRGSRMEKVIEGLRGRATR